jgi:AraC-like DNA-binding protein
MLAPAPFPRDKWIGPIPKNGKHGTALVRLSRPKPSELSYLSWGRRHYGEPSIGPTVHEGWHYFLVLAGNPGLLVKGREIPTGPGLISIGDPNCPIGHRDRPGSICEMLTWVWRTPPTHSALRPEKNGSFRLNVDAGQMRRLKQLHFQCRDAVADCNERSTLQLRATRILIDLCLLEAQEHRRVPTAGLRFELAVQYLRNHLGENQTIHGLCEYLQVSKASLYRLFEEQTGEGPRAFAQKLRMQWAREQLLSPERSVKSVAFALGYRHSPDFSRAFKQHFGVTASHAALRSAWAADDASSAERETAGARWPGKALK